MNAIRYALLASLLGGTALAQLPTATVSPTSGTGNSQTFTVTIANPTYGQFYVGLDWVDGEQTPDGCMVSYDNNSHVFAVSSDGFTSSVGWMTQGSGNPAIAGGCTLQPASTASSSGGTLTMNLAMKFSASIWGSKNTKVTDGGSEWQQKGTWTIVPYSIDSFAITNVQNGGTSATFSINASVYQSVSTIYFEIAPTLNSSNFANLCVVSYTSFGGYAATTGSNPQCTITGSSSSITGANGYATFTVSFASAFAGSKNIYGYVGGSTYNTGWQTLGTHYVPGTVNALSVTPSAGYGMQQTFALHYSSTAGAGELVEVYARFDSGCTAKFVQASNTLYLAADNGTYGSGVAIGSSGTLTNSQCTLDPANTTKTNSGNDLTLSLPVTFKTAYQGAKTTSLYAANASANTGWQNLGTWTVTTVSLTSVSPVNSSGSAQTFTVVVNDSLGATDLIGVYLLFSPTSNGQNACYLYYARASNTVGLLDNTGSTWTWVQAGSGNTPANTQCSLSAAGVSAIGSGNTLTVTFPLTFTSTFTGTKNIYVLSHNAASVNGFQTMGTWNVQSQPDFFLTPFRRAVYVAAGGSTSTVFAVGALGGFNGGVNLTATVTPTPSAGTLTPSFSPSSVTGSGTPTITIAPSSAVPVGNYDIKIVGTSGSLSRDVTIRATVQPSGPYSFYVTDTLNSGNWSQAGTVTATTSTLTATDANGGSLISTVAVPDGSSDYEVRATVNLAGSGGTYTLFTRATSDARTGGTGAGTYYAFEMQNPTFTNGVCSATFVVLKRSGGTVSSLTSFMGGCSATSVLRMSIRPGLLLFWGPNWARPWGYGDSAITTGKGGVGGYGMPSGNSITNVKVGPLDRIAPPAINLQSLGTAVFPNRVEFQWPGVTDDPHGSGLSLYQIYRDGAWFGSSPVPRYSDETLSPNEPHTYTIYGVDQHQNYSAGATITVTAAPANTTEPRRVGVKSTGSYYGAAGEQIDLLSGNLNFTIPLLKAQARGGWGATFALSYNSQMWRHDSGGVWNLGRDVGYGLGWRLMAGSIVPVYNGNSTLHHYVFTDATGAEYRLDQNNNGIWTSKDSIYVSFNADTQFLYFPDGGRWYMHMQSAGEEDDAGTLYPSTMVDTNGNFIDIHYAAGIGVGWADSSARIVSIWDPRFPGNVTPVFTFTYNSDPVPHLTAIANTIGTAESYTFTYLNNQTVSSPFPLYPQNNVSTLLQSVTTTGLGVGTSFLYGLGTGEMTQMTTPLSGNLYWTYRTYTYTGGRDYREVLTRQMTSLAGPAANTWNIILDNASNLHTTATVVDQGAGTSKIWTFTSAGLPASYEERSTANATLMKKDYTWIIEPIAGRSYVGAVTTSLDPCQSYGVQTKSEQTLDQYGNITESKAYNYVQGCNGTFTTPARTYKFRYLHENGDNTNTNTNWAQYGPLYIRNRVRLVTLDGGTLVQNYYDVYNAGNGTPSNCGVLQNSQQFSTIFYHDTTNYGTTFTYRGNLTYTSPMGAIGPCKAYEITGIPYKTVDAAGRTVNISTSSATAYSLPSVITPNGETNLSTTMTYTGFFAVASVTGPNGATGSVGYDIYGRPCGGHSPDGVDTTCAYTYNPNTVKETVGTGTDARWKKSTMDGFGRPTKVETGHGTTTVSVVDTEYAPCACAPLGKLKRTSQPHAENVTPVWTTNTYDGSGRTLTTTLPDGSVTTYLYQGNTVKTTDAALKWKKQTTDAMGNLVTVTEPDPAGGSDYVTTYTYNSLNQLIQVSMPRPTANGPRTQLRTFVYAGPDMVSETNPENGITTYEYNADHQVTKKTQSNGQQTRNVYDAYGRLLQVQHWGWAVTCPPQHPTECSTVLAERPGERADYIYDYNPSFSQNAWGRLAAVVFKNEHPSTRGETFTYQYSYNPAGRVIGQRFTIDGSQPNGPAVLDATYGWDNEGRMTSMTYPGGGTAGGAAPVYTYGFDAMGRTNSMTPTGGSAITATYGIAGEMTSFNGDSRTYNSLFQLTRINAGSAMDIEYNYTAGANNGRIASSVDHYLNETVSYTYDSLSRLTKAETSDNTWGTNYVYDGWGNLTNKTQVTGKNTSMLYSAIIDPATNGGPGAEPAAVNADVSVDKRPLVGNGGYWSYDPSGKRMFWEGPWAPVNISSVTGCRFDFYGINGQKLATYDCYYGDGANGNGEFAYTLKTRNEYFAGKPVTLNGVAVKTDRLGSVRWNGNGEHFNYYPYGEERASTTNGREKFGTYFRDSNGLDYADQRMYDSAAGRFTTPDTYVNSLGAGQPSGWNRFGYVHGDPVNFHDPSGTNEAPLDEQPGVSSYLGMGFFTGYTSEGTPYTYIAQVLITNQGSRSSSGGGYGPGMYTELTYNQVLRQQAVFAIENMSKQCKDALASDGINVTELAVTASGIQFFTTYNSGTVKVKSITGYENPLSPTQTLGGYLGQSRAAVLPNPDGTPSNDVILGNTFFTQASNGQNIATSQNITLVHEALHVATGLGDEDLYTKLGFGVLDASMPGAHALASNTISLWLGQGCQPLR